MKSKNPWRTHQRVVLKMGIIFIIGLLCAGASPIPEDFKTAAEEIQTLSADFVQEKHLKILSTPLISKGLFRYQAPDAFRWEYRSPIKNLVLMQNGDLSRYVWTQNGFRKTTGQGFQGMERVFDEITLWLKGDFDHDPAFRVSFKKEGKIVLVPKQKAFSLLIQKIVLALSDRPGVIKSVTLYEGEDSYTRILFKNIQVNARLKASCFQVPSLSQDPMPSEKKNSTIP
ncbi:MAG: outer membrane lipoprotein carrier protein LolA [Thermodesulfobacteriota bacterium]